MTQPKAEPMTGISASRDMALPVEPEHHPQQSARGVIDHVSVKAGRLSHLKPTFWFLRTFRIGFCYTCQGSRRRRRTHWLICFGPVYSRRICRRCMIRTGVYGWFLVWLRAPW